MYERDAKKKHSLQSRTCITTFGVENEVCGVERFPPKSLCCRHPLVHGQRGIKPRGRPPPLPFNMFEETIPAKSKKKILD